jgi:hypothetical protein
MTDLTAMAALETRYAGGRFRLGQDLLRKNDGAAEEWAAP